MVDLTKIVQFTDDSIAQAAQVIKTGGLVAFATETVYGLGANALDAQACQKVYEAKGRPSDNPLIVHIAKDYDLSQIASDIPPKARILMDAFWAGPITFVLKALPGVFAHGHAGTVAVRMPNHAVAQALLSSAGVPIAAPSANLSGRPSPTTAAHVLQDFDNKIDMILDGGACVHGLESTVIDFSDSVIRILRPGSITQQMIESVIGNIDNTPTADAINPKSPGTKYTHYAPKGKMTLVIGKNAAQHAQCLFKASTSANPIYINPLLGQTYEEVATNLFKVLRQCDENENDEIFAHGFDEDGLGAAIMNRMRKATGNNVITI